MSITINVTRGTALRARFEDGARCASTCARGEREGQGPKRPFCPSRRTTRWARPEVETGGEGGCKQKAVGEGRSTNGSPCNYC